MRTVITAQCLDQVLMVTNAPKLASGGWWGDVLYKSLIASNVWTPDAYPAGWEVLE